MLAIFMNTVMGVSRLTRTPVPEHDTLLLIARKAFEMSDVNNDGCIEYIEYFLSFKFKVSLTGQRLGQNLLNFYLDSSRIIKSKSVMKFITDSRNFLLMHLLKKSFILLLILTLSENVFFNMLQKSKRQ